MRFPRFAAVDDDGAFPALGASLFSAVWQHQNDPDWLEAQLATLAPHRVDYIRALGVVGPQFWSDRTIDPRAAGYWPAVAGVMDRATAHGLRVSWSIFGGVDTLPTPADRRVFVNDFTDALRGREAEILLVEVGNELWQNGIADRDELRELGERLRAALPGVGVALTSPSGELGEACRLYANWPGVATMHYDRDISKGDGRIRPIRQPWGWPGEYEDQGGCFGALPNAVINDEPIGPESSVEGEDDPRRLALAYVTTCVCQHAAYTFHAGPGIRGGGLEDRARGRSATFDALPNGAAMLGALRAARGYVPADLAEWTRHNAQWASAPFVGFDREVEAGRLVRAYMSTRSGEVFGVLLGVRALIMARPRQACTIELLEPTTGDVLETMERGAGEAFTIGRTGDGFVLRARAL